MPEIYFFTIYQSADNARPGHKLLGMSGHVWACAGMCECVDICKIYTCGSNIV